MLENEEVWIGYFVPDLMVAASPSPSRNCILSNSRVSDELRAMLALNVPGARPNVVAAPLHVYILLPVQLVRLPPKVANPPASGELVTRPAPMSMPRIAP